MRAYSVNHRVAVCGPLYLGLKTCSYITTRFRHIGIYTYILLVYNIICRPTYLLKYYLTLFTFYIHTYLAYIG